MSFSEKTKKALGITTTNNTQKYTYSLLPIAFKGTRFWKPIIAVFVGIVLSTILQAVVLILSYYGLNFDKSHTFIAYINMLTGQINGTNLPVLFVMFSSVGVMLPAVFITLFICRMTPIRMISSVELRLRWKFLFKSLLVSLSIILVATLGITALDNSLFDLSLPKEAASGSFWILFIILVFVCIPIQCVAEEYIFRGFIMQTLGAWFKSPVLAILIPSIAFAFAHLYQAWAFFDVLIFGLLSGYLAHKTGGLEASIAIHTANNVFSILSVIFIYKSYDPNASGSFISLLITVVELLAITFIVLFMAKKANLQTTFNVSENLNNKYVLANTSENEHRIILSTKSANTGLNNSDKNYFSNH